MRFTYGTGEQPLSGYTIKRGVGIGGFGEVYFATNDAGKEVALKRIQRNLDVEVRGVKQCLNLRHPNLIGLYDIRFDDSGQGWIVMEYVAGESLRDLLDHRPEGLPIPDALQRFGQIAAGVAYLHDQGIVHRDLKPANIFIDRGLIKIGDYGLSKFISCSRRGGQTESVGTFHYMAPEIGKGEYGKEIDIYALGILLYEMLTGNVPFDGESSQEIILKHLTADPDLRHLPQPYASVIGRALAKNPASRFTDVRDMLAPLGLEIDSSGMAVTSRGPSWTSPQATAPVLEPVDMRTPPAANAAHAVHAPMPEIVFGAVRQHGQQARGAGRNGHSAATSAAFRSPYREPIARAVHGAWLGAQRWWTELPLANPWRSVVMAAIIISLLTSSGVIFGGLFVALLMYFPYYVIWYMVVGSKLPMTEPSDKPYEPPYDTGPSPQVAHAVMPQPIARPVADSPRKARRSSAARPITFRQWQTIQRRTLESKGRINWLHELTGAMVSSAGVVVVLTVVGGLVALATERIHQPGLMAGMTWSAIMALLGSWTVLFFSKKWEHRTEDSAIYRFKLLTAGLVLGGIGYFLSDLLVVPWRGLDFDVPRHNPSPLWKGFYDSTAAPLLPAFLAYFALTFGIARWWRQSESVRRKRFSIAAVVWAIVAAGLVKCLIYFPQPWGMAVFGAMSIAIQLSSPWLDSSSRLTVTSEAPTV